MATRPMTPAQGAAAAARWRAALRRSLRRSAEIAGAVALWAGLFGLALALVSYHQTDPSESTAAGGPVLNWLGTPGAWVAERALFLFGLVAVLLLPLMHVFAVRLWRMAAAEASGEDLPPLAGGRWWRTLALLVVAMALLATALSLTFDSGGTLPASLGGLSGLLGAAAIRAAAAYAPEVARGWLALGAGVTTLAAGVALAARVFAIDWAGLFALPFALHRRAHGEVTTLPAVIRKPRAAAKNLDDDEDDEPYDAPAPAPVRSGSAVQIQARRPPEISDPVRAAKPADLSMMGRQTGLFDAHTLPSLDLLADPPADTGPKVDRLTLERNARLLETVLDDFNVKGEITGVRTGPVVTMYELEPAPGIKAARVIGLADDIARNMSAISARVSSIPGRTVMGIELPNVNREMVSFKEMVASEAFAGHKGMLPIILGKDIAGEPVVADLATMPNLLVAGTTGSGKSVGLNAILVSLLYRLTPAQCRMILVDPKVLELKSYDDIPHLLSPVVTEPTKAVRALKWAVEEMERRYRKMSELSVRNLTGFNDKVRKAQEKGKPLGRRISVGFDPDTGEELFEDHQLDYAVLPQIVVIVDELADLMVTVGKEIEVLIQRLAQKSRAAGIHLIMATQRPSVDVITGVIKANLPTRISFAVTSRIDSRTILGEQGAEQLLGKGDMLYKPSSDPLRRVHGPFVSDEEVERVADHWRAQGKPDYVDSVTEEPEEGSFGFDDLDATASDNPEERKYRQACQIVFESQKASTSWLQRQMTVGYNTAAKWIERMEEDGFVGPANHVGRREIYRDKDGNPL